MKFRNVLFLITGFIIVIAGFIGCDESSDPVGPVNGVDTTAFVRGIVTDAESNGGVANATIASDGGQSTTSADDGSYLLQIFEGECTLTTTAEGYENGVQTFEISRQDTNTVDFSLAPEAVEAEPATISGQVMDASTEEGVAGAQITWDGGETDCDNSGNYSVEVVAGSYTLTATAEDYDPAEEDVIAEAGGTYSVDFLVTNNAVPQLGTVSGLVRNRSTRAVIVGATVGCNGHEAFTDDEGRYSIEVEPGSRVVVVFSLGFETLGLDVNVVVGESRTLNFDLDSNGGNENYAQIYGVVTDSATQFAIGGARVAAGGETATTDNFGRYSLDVWPGNHSIVVTADGYNPVSQGIAVDAGMFYAVNFSLTPTGGGGGGDDTGILTGRVYNNTNSAGIAGARVECAGVVVQTDGAGNYRMTVPAGIQRLNVGADGFANFSGQANIIADQTVTQNVGLTPGGGGGGGTGTILGRIFNSTNNNGIGFATIVIAGREIHSSVDGTYGMRDVPAGLQTITVSADGFDPATQNANVVADQEVTANIGMNPNGGGDGNGQVLGRVTNSQGNGIAGARINASDGQSTVTNGSGNYDFFVASGNRSITAAAAGYGSKTQNLLVINGRQHRVNFTLQN